MTGGEGPTRRGDGFLTLDESAAALHKLHDIFVVIIGTETGERHNVENNYAVLERTGAR
jgi:hypothetical protein